MFIACGSSKKNPPPGDDQTGDDQPPIDGSDTNDSTFGEDCTGGGSGDGTVCGSDSESPACVSLTGTTFFCTAGCGVGPCATGGSAGSDSCFMNGSDQAAPPSGGDAACGAIPLSSGTGTPACVLASVIPVAQGGTQDMGVVWACGILCGDDGSGGDFGTCPDGLTCTNSICQ